MNRVSQVLHDLAHPHLPPSIIPSLSRTFRMFPAFPAAPRAYRTYIYLRMGAGGVRTFERCGWPTVPLKV